MNKVEKAIESENYAPLLVCMMSDSRDERIY